MVTTKEQERKALEQIRKIVAGLGENSYVGIAFEGCFEIAEENIENDFGCSMKQRAESARKEAEDFKGQAERLLTENNRQTEELVKLQKRVLEKAEYEGLMGALAREYTRQKEAAEDAAKDIVQYADNPDSNDFRCAVELNRRAKNHAEMAHTLQISLQKRFYA